MLRLSLLGLLILSLVPTAKAQEVKGTIKKLDLETGVLLIRPYLTDKEQELSLAARNIPVINALGEPAKLVELRVGLRVALKLTNEFVTEAKFDGPSVWGYLRQVDPQTRTLQVEDIVRLRTYTLPENGRVVVDGIPKSLQDFKVGQPVQVLLTPDGKSPLQFAQGRGVHLRDPYRKLTRLTGVLLEADPKTQEVSVLIKPSGEPMHIAKMKTQADVAVRLDLNQKRLREVGLDAIKNGPFTASLIIDAETQEVDGIEVEIPTYRRKLVAVDLKEQTVTLEELKTTRKFPLDPQFIVLTSSGKLSKLSELKEGKAVTCGLSPDRSRVIVIQH